MYKIVYKNFNRIYVPQGRSILIFCLFFSTMGSLVQNLFFPFPLISYFCVPLIWAIWVLCWFSTVENMVCV